MTPPFTDAENITSYPFVVSSSPDNADALRTKRQRSRAERDPYKEEEISLNAGHEHSGSRRGLRQAGRSCPDDRNCKLSVTAFTFIRIRCTYRDPRLPSSVVSGRS